MESITLVARHIRILKNADLKDEFIAGLDSLFQGKEPQASCPFMEDVFYSLVHGRTAKAIPGIPKFDPKGMKENELDRYSRLQAGKVPSAGLDHPYKDLDLRPITTLPKKYLGKLYSECQDKLNRKQGTPDYRRFLVYLAEVLKHCEDSGEL